MKKYLLNFATSQYQLAAARLRASACLYFDQMHLRTPNHLDKTFLELHQPENKRGFGFWAWKPYLILNALRYCNSDDVLMYSDAQCVFVRDPSPLFELCGQNDGILLFDQRREGHINAQYTKRYCFVAMNCLSAWHKCNWQLNAAFSVWKKTTKAVELLEQWYHWCCNEKVIDDSNDEYFPNQSSFITHRHDQSIISLLAIEHGIKTYPDCSQFGNGCEENSRGYSQILEFRRDMGAM